MPQQRTGAARANRSGCSSRAIRTGTPDSRCYRTVSLDTNRPHRLLGSHYERQAEDKRSRIEDCDLLSSIVDLRPVLFEGSSTQSRLTGNMAQPAKNKKEEL